jgi:hypothetical protein
MGFLWQNVVTDAYIYIFVVSFSDVRYAFRFLLRSVFCAYFPEKLRKTPKQDHLKAVKNAFFRVIFVKNGGIFENYFSDIQ